MRDPYIHVEHDQLMTHAEMRDFLTAHTGLAFDLPKTVRTGCDKRRPLAMTSAIPERVTCLACREYAARWNAQQAADAESLLGWLERDPEGFGPVKVTPAELAAQSRSHRAMAARFAA